MATAARACAQLRECLGSIGAVPHGDPLVVRACLRGACQSPSFAAEFVAASAAALVRRAPGWTQDAIQACHAMSIDAHRMLGTQHPLPSTEAALAGADSKRVGAIRRSCARAWRGRCWAPSRARSRYYIIRAPAPMPIYAYTPANTRSRTHPCAPAPTHTCMHAHPSHTHTRLGMCSLAFGVYMLDPRHGHIHSLFLPLFPLSFPPPCPHSYPLPPPLFLPSHFRPFPSSLAPSFPASPLPPSPPPSLPA